MGYVTTIGSRIMLEFSPEVYDIHGNHVIQIGNARKRTPSEPPAENTIQNCTIKTSTIVSKLRM
jgi:hypothetical protein